MISAQGLWIMMFFASLHHSGLYSPSPLRALLGRAPAPVSSPPAPRRGGWSTGPTKDTAGKYVSFGRSLYRISSVRSDIERENVDGDEGEVAVAEAGAQATGSGSARWKSEAAEPAEAASDVVGAAPAAEAAFVDDNDPRGNMALRDEVLHCIRRGVSEACSVPYAELPAEGSDLHLELEASATDGIHAHSLGLRSALPGPAGWWRRELPAKRDGAAEARPAASNKWAHAANGPAYAGLSSSGQGAIDQLSPLALSAVSAATPISRGSRSPRFMLHSSLAVLQLLSLSWLLFARQVSGPAGIAAQWSPMPRALLSCTATQCVLDASRRDRAAALAAANVAVRERDGAWPGLERAGAVAAWLWDVARSETGTAALRHEAGQPLLAPGRSTREVEQVASGASGAGGREEAGPDATDAVRPRTMSAGSNGRSEGVDSDGVGSSGGEQASTGSGFFVERKGARELAPPSQLPAPPSLFGRRRRLSLLPSRVDAAGGRSGRRRMAQGARIHLDDEDSAAFGEWAYLIMTGAPSGSAAWVEWAEQGHTGQGLVDPKGGDADGTGGGAVAGGLGGSSPASAWGQHAWNRISEGGKALASATEAQVRRPFTL
jgi:hypothetical protein